MKEHKHCIIPQYPKWWNKMDINDKHKHWMEMVRFQRLFMIVALHTVLSVK